MGGIYGIGGSGKTTIAKAVYNSIATQFECTCFLADIREGSTRQSLVGLQERILMDMLGNNLRLSSVHQGISVMRDRLSNRKILLFLDDVDNLQHLKALAGEPTWFGPGSKVIITTTDRHLLVAHGVRRMYKVKEFSNHETLEHNGFLFCPAEVPEPGNNCSWLKELPNVSMMPELVELRLDFCYNLVKIHDSVCHLEKLQVFTAVSCLQLNNFPAGNGLKSLKLLNLTGCRSIKNFPNVSRSEYLERVYLSDTAIDIESISIQDVKHPFVVLPGVRIPRNFRICTNEESISFWITRVSGIVRQFCTVNRRRLES